MFLTTKLNFNKIEILNLLICTIPLSLILGNLATNINILLICLLGLVCFGKKIFFFHDKKISFYLLYFFFFYLIIVTFGNNITKIYQNDLYYDHLIKSILYLRFLILFLVINKLAEKREFNTKYFFLSCAFFSLIISLDVVYQFIFKKNILGFPITNDRPSSFFGEENIAGNFIQKFILFFIFYYASKIKNTNNVYRFIFISSIFFLIIIIFTANKMAIIIFIFSIISFYLIEKKFKQLLLIFFISSFLLFSFSKIVISKRLHTDINFFFTETSNIVRHAPSLFISGKLNPESKWGTGYLIHFNTGIQIWKKNKIFGNGLKSFRLKCKYGNNQTCNTHPHNYFIELLVDTGFIGLLVICLIIFFGLKNFFLFFLKNKTLHARLTTSVFFLLIFFELFPFRSTGSFFTTSNSIFIFLMLAIILNVEKIKKL